MKKILFFLLLFYTYPSYSIEFNGRFIQGHFITGKTEPGSKIIVGKKEVKVSKDGYFVFGIDRDRKFDISITKIINGKKEIITKQVLKRKYNIQRIDGLEEILDYLLGHELVWQTTASEIADYFLDHYYDQFVEHAASINEVPHAR